MKFIVQRVLESSVSVDGETIGKIGKGYMVLIGVGNEDTKEIADKMIKKWLVFGFLRMRTVRQIFLLQM